MILNGSRKNSSELIELSSTNKASLVWVPSCSNTESIRDDPYWTSRKNNLELISRSSINNVSLVQVSYWINKRRSLMDLEVLILGGKASHFFEGKAELGLVPRNVHTWFVIIVDQDWNCLNFTNGMSPY